MLLSVPEIDDLDRVRIALARGSPDPLGAVAEDHSASREREAAPLGFAAHALGEGGRAGVGVGAGGALDRGRTGDRAGVADGAALGVGGLGAPDHDELGFARLGGPVRLLAGASGRLALAHRHAGAVHAEVHGRGGGRSRLGRPLLLARGDLAAQGLGGALDVLGAHAHSGQVVQQSAGLRETDQGGGRAAHAGHARGQVGARHAQRAVAREEALPAGGAVVVGALQGQAAQDRLEGLGAAPGVARRLPARARPGRAGVIAAVGVEAEFDGARRQFQRALPQAGLQGLEVDRVRGAGSYETGELGFDGGGEGLCAGFFLASARVSVPVWRKRASASCSLSSTRAAVRRRKRWYSSSWAWTAAAAAVGREREVRLPSMLRTSRK